MKIFSSRFTPGVCGSKVSFMIGEKVRYKLLNGKLIDIIIKSERMSHEQCSSGYEALRLDNNEMVFIDPARIVDWDGRIQNEAELDRLLGINGNLST